VVWCHCNPVQGCLDLGIDLNGNGYLGDEAPANVVTGKPSDFDLFNTAKDDAYPGPGPSGLACAGTVPCAAP